MTLRIRLNIENIYAGLTTDQTISGNLLILLQFQLSIYSIIRVLSKKHGSKNQLYRFWDNEPFNIYFILRFQSLYATFLASNFNLSLCDVH
jgi:hypothetical protein